MRKSIVIVGGGFAGVDCARHLERRLPDGWDLYLLSRENHIVFTPLLAEVVGASISPLHVVWPIRQRLRRTTCRTVTVSRLNLNDCRVEYQPVGGSPAELSFDHLVLACGSVVNMDMMPGLAAHAFPLKTLGDAFTLRNHLIQQLERAEVETDPERRRHLLSIAVIGGGFSGVEVAGEMYDLLAASRKYYPVLRADDFRVVLLHSPKRLLPEMPESLGEFARVRMQARGIDIRLGIRAQAVTEAGVHLADGIVIPAGTIVCTIGNMANPLITESGLPLDRGRIRTEPDMRVTGHSNVWALGDCAVVPNAYDGQPSPPVAQFAVRQAKQLAANLRRAVAEQPTRPFSYRMIGSFAAIGHRKAVGRVLGVNFSGFLAWFLWRGIYLGKMPTLARRVQIAFDWAWQLIFPRDIVQLSRRETERLPREHFQPGEYVFRKGDLGDKFYLIERGRVGVYLDDAGPAVAFLGPGQFFGERALIRAEKRWASLRAEDPLDVLSIRRGPFQDLLANLAMFRSGMEDHVSRVDSAWKFEQAFRDHPRLSRVLVREAMTGPVRTLPATLGFAEAIARFQREGRDAFVVLDEQLHMAGICTATDLHRAMCDLKPLATPLSEIMRRPVLTISESKSLADAMLMFIRHPVKRLVVVAADDETRPIGILTPFDILLHYTGEGTNIPQQV